MKYTDQQKRAINSKAKRLMIRSVAGSGKTTTIVARIEKLIRKGVDSDRILVLTFTNKMAAELISRLPTLSWVGNFHSIALRILNQFSTEIGYRDEPLTAISEIETKTILKETMERQYYRVPMKDLLEYMKLYYEKGIVANRKFRLFIQEYDRYLKKHNIIDFARIEYDFLKLLKLPVGNKIRKFQYIFVDEFQDTSLIEMAILEALDPPYICVVGDVAQNIYEWRGTTISNIVEFEADQVIETYRTFRVPNKQMLLVNNVLSKNTFGYSMTMRSNIEGSAPVIQRSENIEQDLKEVVDKCLTIFQPKDIMILCRTNYQVREVCKILNSLPLEAIQSNMGWNTEVGTLLIEFYRFCLDMSNNYTVERLIKGIRLDSKEVITRWISTADIENKSLVFIISESKESGSHLFEELISLATRREYSLVDKARKFFDIFVLPIMRMDDLGLELTIEKCIDTVKLFEEKKGPHIHLLLDWLTTLNTQDMITDDNTIKIMTFHTAKGLESEVVILPWIEDGLFPRDPFSDEFQAELRLFYVGITRTKKLLYILETGESSFYSKEKRCLT